MVQGPRRVSHLLAEWTRRDWQVYDRTDLRRAPLCRRAAGSVLLLFTRFRRSQEPPLYLPTLAFQLAHKYPGFRSTLIPLLQSNPDIGHESLFNQMRVLIVEPLNLSDVSTHWTSVRMKSHSLPSSLLWVGWWKGYQTSNFSSPVGQNLAFNPASDLDYSGH